MSGFSIALPTAIYFQQMPLRHYDHRVVPFSTLTLKSKTPASGPRILILQEWPGFFIKH